MPKKSKKWNFTYSGMMIVDIGTMMVKMRQLNSASRPLKLKRANPYATMRHTNTCMMTDGTRMVTVFIIDDLKSSIWSASTKLLSVNVFGIQMTVGSRRSTGSRNAFESRKSTGYRRTYDMPIRNSARRMAVVTESVFSAIFFCLSSFIAFSLVKSLVACAVEQYVHEHDNHHDNCKVDY